MNDFSTMGPCQLQLGLAPVKDVELVVGCVKSEPLVGLHNPFGELQGDGVLQAPTEVYQEEQRLLDDPYVRLLEDAYAQYLSTFLQVWLEFVPDALLIGEREVCVGLLVVLEETLQLVTEIVLQWQTLDQAVGDIELLLQILFLFSEST